MHLHLESHLVLTAAAAASRLSEGKFGSMAFLRKVAARLPCVSVIECDNPALSHSNFESLRLAHAYGVIAQVVMACRLAVRVHDHPLREDADWAR
jgi:hypothetical protein